MYDIQKYSTKSVTTMLPCHNTVIFSFKQFHTCKKHKLSHSVPIVSKLLTRVFERVFDYLIRADLTWSTTKNRTFDLPIRQTETVVCRFKLALLGPRVMHRLGNQVFLARMSITRSLNLVPVSCSISLHIVPSSVDKDTLTNMTHPVFVPSFEPTIVNIDVSYFRGHSNCFHLPFFWHQIEIVL